MKYAKKMKLVEIDDIPHHSGEQSYLSHATDEKFTAPRTLSMLDKSMNAILECSDMDDGAKWTLYHQTLQRYLNHMRTTQKSNTHQLDENERMLTPDPFTNHISDHNISGVFPIKDSINNISMPVVRDFFQNARESDVNLLSPIRQTSPVGLSTEFNITPAQNQQQAIQHTQKGTKKTRKRPPKRNASKDITDVHPRKLVVRNPGNTPPRGNPRQLYRSRQPPQSNFDFYWEDSKAK